MHSISVYSRDSTSGLLTFKNRITATTSFENESLAYAQQTLVTNNDRFLYTVTNWNGSGGLVVLKIDSLTDSLNIIQSFRNEFRPGFINMTSDNRIVSVSSGITYFLGAGATIFYEADPATGLLRYKSTYRDAAKYSLKKCIDKENRYFYTCPAFSDTIHIHRFNLFLDSVLTLCTGDSILLRPFGSYNSVKWSTGDTTPTIFINKAGTYSITVKDGMGREYSDSVRVIVRPWPIVSLGNDTTLFEGEAITLQAGTDFISYRWSTPGDTLNLLNFQNKGLKTGPEYYSVTVRDSFGCTGSDTIMILFSNKKKADNINFSINPNPFSFQTLFVADKVLSNASLIFYDQSGKQVKAIRNINVQKVIVTREDLMPGIYYMQLIQGKEKFRTQKILITEN